MADKNVLILEKDQKFLKPLKLYFRQTSYDAITASDEGEFLAGIRQNKPDILLVAVESDDAESRSLMGKLKNLGLPIVVMSSKADEAELFGGGVSSVGAHGYIKKPFIKKNILEKLDEVIAAAPRTGGVDLGSVFSEVDNQLDNFLSSEGGGNDAVAISLEEESPVAFQTHPAPGLPNAEIEAPFAAAQTAPHAAPAAPPVDESVPADVPAEIRRLRERVLELERELYEKAEDFKKVEREKEQLERSVGKKESDLIDKIKSLERTNEELEEDVKKRKNLVAQMTASVQQLNEELEDKDKRHDRAVDDGKQQLARLQAEYDGLGEKSSNQAHEIEDKTDEIARQKRRIEDLEAERNELTANLERMTEAKTQGDETVARLEQELATERARIAEGKTRLEAGLTDLGEKLLGELSQARDALEKGLASAREAAEEASRKTREEAIGALLGK